jgi:hypothetical protein
MLQLVIGSSATGYFTMAANMQQIEVDFTVTQRTIIRFQANHVVTRQDRMKI